MMRLPRNGRHLIITAHPDDETISCSYLLSTLADVRILQLTDGVPPHGAGREALVTHRRGERETAFRLAGWLWPVVDCGLRAREAHRSLAVLVTILREACAATDIIWTHPYEGGHLDHDTAAWLCQAVTAVLPIQRMEFASYHATTAKRSTFGAFWPDATVSEVTVRLDESLLTRKRTALEAYGSQASILRKFPTWDQEAYRHAPTYDFTQPSAPPRARWDTRDYHPTTAEWRAVIARHVKREVL